MNIDTIKNDDRVPGVFLTALALFLLWLDETGRLSLISEMSHMSASPVGGSSQGLWSGNYELGPTPAPAPTPTPAPKPKPAPAPSKPVGGSGTVTNPTPGQIPGSVGGNGWLNYLWNFLKTGIL
jgi:hypothetical protein